MKKFLVTLLAFLYITSSCEATVYLHYCMGKKVGFGLSPEKSAKCPRCGMHKSDRDNGCCKDEQKTFRSEKNQNLPDPVFATSQQKCITLVSARFTYTLQPTLSGFIDQPQIFGSPGTRTVPAYIMNCLLLI